MIFDVVVVGAGISGCTFAYNYARIGKSVLLLEKRNHIGGNCYDEYNQAGILVHRYGPHIFHTNNKKVWQFVSQFTEWIPYTHRVLSYVDGKMLPFPINQETINQLYGLNLDENGVKEFFKSRAVKIKKIKNGEDLIVSQVGWELYKKFFKNYTEKQWGMSVKKIAPEVLGRIPIRTNRDNCYFSDHKYQGIPQHGYTAIFKKMLKNPRIIIILRTDYKKIINRIKYKKLVYTGPIDYFFNYRFGKLPYRSLQFHWKTYNQEHYQPVAVVNYPNNYQFTRIVEYKHFTRQKINKTTVSREYPSAEGEPYYPVLTKENIKLYKKYRVLASKIKNILFVGRLATYQYLNMDKAWDNALKYYESSKKIF